jgi:hypothetical protein
MKLKNNFPPKAFEELSDLLSQLSFTDERADYREGTHWAVYAHPWVGEEEGCFDAQVTVIPRSSEAVSHQGLRLRVCRGNTIWLNDGVTNRRGQAWFKQLPLGRFSACLVDIAGSEDQVPEKELALAADSFDRPPQESFMSFQDTTPQENVTQAILPADRIDHVTFSEEESSTEPRTYYLPDRRLVALLEQGENGCAVLTIETEKPELAGAVVHFTLGQETGEIPLKPTDPPGAWSGHCELKLSFRTAETCVPTFEVVQLQQQAV